MYLRSPGAGMPDAPAPMRVPWRARAAWRVGDHKRGVLAAGVIAVAGVAIQAARLATAPPARGREGALVAAGWSIIHVGSAGDATFSPTATSLAPVQLAAWMWASGALSRASGAIAAGRELMLVAHAVSVPLVWLLARRFGLTRWAAGLAAFLCSVSPLAVALHRPVHGAGLAVPWMLAALVLASSRRPRALTALGAGASLAVAVLTEPSVVVVAPALGWVLWRSSPGAGRPWRLSLPGAVAFVVVWATVAAAVTTGGAPAPAAQLDLLDRVRLVVDGRSPGGGITGFDGRSVADLIGLDRVGVALALLAAAVVPPVVPRLVPLACAFWACAALTLAADVPTGAVVVMVPFGALLLAAGAQLVLVWYVETRVGARTDTHRTSRAVRRLDAAAPVMIAAALVAAAVALPDWVATHRRLATDDAGAPVTDARKWVVANLRGRSRVIVDDAVWVDVVEGGVAPSRLAGYGAVAGGWRSYDYIVTTPTLRTAATPPEIAAAVESSLAVAGVGEGDERVEVRRISPAGVEPMLADERARHEARAAAGTALARNPAIAAPSDAVAQLRGGEVDERVTAVLATLAGAHRLEIGGFVRLPGESLPGATVRTVDLTAIDGRPIAADDPGVAEAVAFLDNQRPQFRPQRVGVVASATGEPSLRITFPIGQEDPG